MERIIFIILSVFILGGCYSGYQLKTTPEMQNLHRSLRFINNNDGTVTDTVLNIMWLKDAHSFKFFTTRTYSEALQGVNEFEFLKYSDWRLPTKKELSSIVDETKAPWAIIIPSPFNNIIFHVPYWTSSLTSYKGNCKLYSWGIQFSSGKPRKIKHKETALVFPVRDIKP